MSYHLSCGFVVEEFMKFLAQELVMFLENMTIIMIFLVDLIMSLTTSSELLK